MNKNTTETDYDREWNYRYTERLGIMCGSADPTPKQIHIAKTEADEAVRLLKRELTENGNRV